MGQLTSVTPTVTFTPTGDKLANCTAGVLNIDMSVAVVTTPAQYIANNTVINSSVL
jgi:hypothetical protein